MSVRRQVALFVVLVLAITWSIHAYIAVNGGVRAFGPGALVLLMWIPGLLSLVLRIAFKSGFADAGFVLGGTRYYAHAIGIPCATATMLALICAISDIRVFDLPASDVLRDAAPVFLALGALGLFGAFGEELGWRGYLLPKMIAAGVRRPYLLSSLVWSVWHLPLIAFGGLYSTAAVLPMTVAYALGVLAIGFVISELRVRSGSVFVATALHAVHNFVFQLVVPVALLTRPGSRGEWWDIVGGDTGFLVAVLYALAFIVMRQAAKGPSGPRHLPE